MDPYLTDLLDRMSDQNDTPPGPGYKSADSVSWKALREAENLTDPAHIPGLQDFIRQETEKRRRRSGYFALGKLAKNTGDPGALVFLIGRITQEKDKYVLSSLLLLIADLKKPLSMDITPILAAVQRKETQIRHSAMQALRCAVDPAAEACLIDILNTSADTYDILYAGSTLAHIGTTKALPALEKFRSSRKKDIKQVVTSAMDAIAQRGSDRN